MTATLSPRGLDWSHIRLSYVAPIYINKPNADTVLEILADYAKYPAEILDRVLFVIVDDGSPVSYTLPAQNLNLIHLRIKEDIPWNNPGARNLGMVYAKSDKVFLTDIDHQLSPESFRKILNLPAPHRTLWRLPRFAASGQKFRSHANTFVLSRAFFLKNYGYDEAFCGHYACDDVMFVKNIKQHGGWVRTLHNGATAIHRDVKSPDGSTHSLVRDKVHNKLLIAEKLKLMYRFGAHAGHSRDFLNFDWDVVAIHRRDVPPPEKVDKLWRYLWWFRALNPFG